MKNTTCVTVSQECHKNLVLYFMMSRVNIEKTCLIFMQNILQNIFIKIYEQLNVYTEWGCGMGKR